ncbi:aminotransferase class I/II-fold pyridoxal phosphate-dependent enzyme [Paracoccus sp. S-4012]|uniref:aminotransferase-like domain-containing protein n=1 Tax=Paracoccus sp. S-4012 TaxID=2665648 RepID=UPI0012B11B19|nr:PLP-dependent aminotransferase family protein [Paracoccus sp. S-4012]MRX50017.1 aminotransferase class I/II-fold pyridoxal phosphate-dependent enzyme [Paracoccus sp. S-4012]
MTRAPFARWMGQTNDVTRTFLGAGQIPGLVNLGGGLPDPSTWPVAELSELARRAVADTPEQSLAYPPIEGLPALRDAIAARFSAPGLSLTRENVLIVSGGMQGLDLIGKVLLDEGGVVAAQSPAYLGALDAWRPRGPVYRPMRLQDDPDLHAALQGAQFAYAVPNFSNPSGRLVPTAQRRALVEAAQATGAWLVEDDPYGTLYYDSAPLPRMLTLSGDPEGPVIYMGTLSKELAPGFRVGWVIAAREMIEALALAKQGSDMCTAGLSQVIAAEALTSGLVDRCLPATLDLYRARRDALLGAMERDLAHAFRWERPAGGMFVWARARDPRLDTDALLAEGLEHGVCISPSSAFDPEGRDRGAVRLNFTLNTPERLKEGVRRLALAVEALTRRAA